MPKDIKILLVEDEALIAMDLKYKLDKSGYSGSQVVATGEAALSCEDREHPDLFIMDNRLAGELDGFETAKRIHRGRDVPIILVSGYSFEDFIPLIEEIRPLACLSKPLKFDELHELLDQAFPD
jgi:two-component system, response regulator PdtaR